MYLQNYKNLGYFDSQIKGGIKIPVDIIKELMKGGPAMYPLLALSILTLSVVFERLWFWLRILSQEKEIVARILDAARENWSIARDIAQQATNQPIGRFLYAPLSLPKADVETFKLALEANAEDELSGMRRGEKFLEAAIALAPLLGLFGTVWGLYQALRSLSIDQVVEKSAEVTTGIGQSLISTASGMVVAIVALAFYRLFQGLIVNQVRIFRRAGNDLELLYRQSPQRFANDLAAMAITAKSTPNNFSFPARKTKNKFSSDSPTELSDDTEQSQPEN
jgi:biopolymer transport protein ExbB